MPSAIPVRRKSRSTAIPSCPFWVPFHQPLKSRPHGPLLSLSVTLASFRSETDSPYALVQRDEAALLVWCNDAERVAQRFLQVEHQLRHYARQCKCAAAPCSREERSEPSTDAQLVLSHNHGYLFASQHDSSSSEELDVGSSSELSELDIPFRPLDVDDIMHDLQVCTIQMV